MVKETYQTFLKLVLIENDGLYKLYKLYDHINVWSYKLYDHINHINYMMDCINLLYKLSN